MDGRSQICHPWPELSDNWKQWTTTTCFSWTSDAKFGGRWQQFRVKLTLLPTPNPTRNFSKSIESFNFERFIFDGFTLQFTTKKALSRYHFCWSIKKPAKWLQIHGLLWFKLPKMMKHKSIFKKKGTSEKSPFLPTCVWTSTLWSFLRKKMSTKMWWFFLPRFFCINIILSSDLSQQKNGNHLNRPSTNVNPQTKTKSLLWARALWNVDDPLEA